MVQIHFDIDDDLNDRFKKSLVKKLGFKKGNIQIAGIEALELFIKKYPTE